MMHKVSFISLLAFRDQNQVAKFHHTYHTSFRRVGPTKKILHGGDSFLTEAIQVRGGAENFSKTHLKMSNTMASLLAGSVGGAIGVGLAYPFDTLSTKAQVNVEKNASHLGFGNNIMNIWKSEGLAGFFEGVLITMIGQALIKAVLFATNEFTYLWLEKNSSIKSNVIKMATAGLISGITSSFVASPVELVKVRMQAQNKIAVKKEKENDYPEENEGECAPSPIYTNELDCARWVVKNEGWEGLFFHGLGMTIFREIPSFAIYFVVYGLLTRSSMAASLGDHVAPLLFGALAGWAMWIPTYPIDILKTIVQVQTPVKGGKELHVMLSSRQIAEKLYRSGGIPAFFDGLKPKLARAAIKHAVTFWVYEVVMNVLRSDV